MPKNQAEVHAALRTKHVRTLEVLQTLIEENSTLKGEVERLEANRGVVIDLEERAAILAKARAESEETIKQLRADLEARDAKIAELEAGAKGAWAAAKEQTALKAELAKLRKTAEELTGSLEATQAAADEAQKASADKDTEISKLKEQLQAASDSLNELQKERDHHKKAHRQSIGDHDTAAQELLRQQARADKLEEQEKKLRASVKELKAEVKELHEKLTGKTTDNFQLQQDLNEFQKVKEKLEGELRRLRGERSDHNQTNEMLRDALRDKEEFAALLQQEKQAHMGTMNSLDSERQHRAALANANQQLQLELDRLKGIAGKNSNFGKYVSVKEENNRLKDQVGNLQHTTSKMQQKMHKQKRRMRAAGILDNPVPGGGRGPGAGAGPEVIEPLMNQPHTHNQGGGGLPARRRGPQAVQQRR